MKKVFLSILLLSALGAQVVWADVTASYYSSLNGLKDDALREALTELLYTKHTQFVSYNWDFPYDYDSDGNMLDIYSSCGYNNHNTYPSSYKCCCDAVNREHVVCQSNFGGSSNNGKVPQYSDRHHLYPVDGRANGHRSDLPFGECSGGAHGTCNSSSTILPDEGTSTCSNHEYGKSGSSTFSVALPSGGGSVYEVGDEYKGDIARAILYMVVRYADKAHCRLPDGAKNSTTNLLTANDYPVTAWANTTKDKVGQMFSSSLITNHGLSDYGMALLLKWHRQDPVSQKEIDRNTGVEEVQGNRNPFVDYPYLVEYLWGGKTNTAFSTGDVVGSFEDDFVAGVSDGSKVTVTTPTIVRPTEAIDLGSTSIGVALAQSVIIQGANLTGGLTLGVTGTDASSFTLSQTSMTQSVATNGKAITITYLPTAAGDHSATLRISGGGLSAAHEVALSGSCCEQYAVTLSRNGESEVVYSCGEYTLPSVEADACSGWTFKGWTDSSEVDGTTAPTFVTKVSEAKTVYAVYGQTEGTGGSNTEYTLFSGTLSEGDYLIYYNGKAMKAKVASNRLQYNEVTPTDDVITTSEDSIIWHIAPSGDYWTLYNERVEKYAAGTGAASRAQLLADGTDDKSLWRISGSSTYEFINKQNEANSVKDTLRNNGTYGFACYSNKTGGALSLYQRGTAITTYKTVPCPAYRITLADEDGFATGGQYKVSATSAQAGTTITLEYEVEDGYTFDGWSVTKADDASTEVSVTSDAFVMPAYDVQVQAVFTLIPTYTATWMANGSVHSSQSGLYAGETPTMPGDAESCSPTRLFMGWTSDGSFSKSDEAPNDLFTASAPTISNADVTFYAVYADKEISEGAGTSYVKVTSDEDITDGQYLIVYETGSVAFNGGLETLDVVSNTIEVTISDNTIAANETTNAASFTINTTDHTIQSQSGYYIGKSNKYENGLQTSQTDKYVNTLSISEGNFVCQGAAQENDIYVYLRYNSASNQLRFRYYKNASQQAIQLYKRNSASTTTYSGYSLYCSEATYEVTFKVKGVTHATRSGHAGGTIEAVSTPEAVGGYTFLGWSTQQYSATNTTLPTIDYTGKIPDANTTYHAVFTNEASVLTSDYERITESSSLTTGNYVIAGYNTAYYALSTVIKATYYRDGIVVTPNEDIISKPGDSIIWQIVVDGEQVSIHNADSGYLYIVQSGSYYNIKIGDNTSTNKFTYSVTNGNWLFTSVSYSTRVLEYYASSGRWTFYSSADAPVYLYKQKAESAIYTTSPSDTATGVESHEPSEISIEKVLINNQLLILRGENVYTIQGIQIQ